MEWFELALFMIVHAMIAIVILYLIQIRPSIQTNLCKECGYNLTGNTSGICPECGEGDK